MPPLPPQFVADLEVDIQESSESAFITEYYDSLNGPYYRFDLHGPANAAIHSETELWRMENSIPTLYETTSSVTTNNQNVCIRQTFPGLMFAFENDWQSVTFSGVMHLQTTLEVFQYAIVYPTTYIARETINGIIPVDHWRTNVVGTTPLSTQINVIVDYYLLASPAIWSTPGSDNIHPIPIRVVINGSETTAFGVYNTYRIYGYASFLPQQPDTSNWMISSSWLCPSTNPSKVMPTLPTQFVTNVEIDAQDANLSAYVIEYYDNINGPYYRFDYHGPSNAATHTETEFWRMENGVPTLYETTSSASTNNLNVCVRQTFPGLLFAFENDWQSVTYNGGLHLQTTLELFQYASVYPTTYIGLETIRNIPVDHWQTLAVGTSPLGTQINYQIQYYLLASSTTWSTPGSDNIHPIPVQVIISGSETTSTKVYNATRYYEYFDFLPQPPSTSLWVIDPTWGCSGSNTGLTMPTLPAQYTTYIEIDVQEKSTTGFAIEAYDSINGPFARWEYHGATAVAALIAPYEIELFGPGGSGMNLYEIENNNGVWNCSLINVNSNQPEIEADWNSVAWGGVHIQTTQELFKFATVYPTQFVATEVNSVRGTTVNHFVTTVSATISTGSINFAIHYYWLPSSGWTSVGSGGSSSIPMRVYITGTEIYNGATYNVSRYYEYIDFIPGQPPTSPTFDLNPSWGCTPCWSYGQVCPDGTCAGNNNNTSNYYPCCAHGGYCATSSTTSSRPSDGWIILLLFIGLVVGIGIGAGGLLLYLRRKEIFKKTEFLN